MTPHLRTASTTLPASVADPAPLEARWKQPGLASVALVLLVWSVFGQTLGFAFTNYDDGDYVYDNPNVTNGISRQSVLWAFTHTHAANWHPLTWISHMADAQVFGANAGGHHATSILLHTAVVLLLFFVLREMTAAFWPSLFVAAVFAIHPLRAESVAWVAERKDVLSGVFFMLTLGAYARFARATRRARWWYAAALACFALGLLAKPSLVTLPFVLLLLDYWPLRRLESVGVGRRLLEKAPFLALSAGSCIATVHAQTQAIMSVADLSLPVRFGNAVCGYATYLWQMVYPVDLAVLYPLRIPPWWMTALALTVLALISAVAFIVRRRQPWVAVGWLWYLGVLVPMIGLMQVGSQAHADRYTYLSQIGLYIAVAWTLAAWAGSRRVRHIILGGGAAVALTVLAACAYRQVTYWRESETLWRHTLACTTRNPFAHNLLAVALARKGERDQALAEFQKSLRINARDAGTHFYLGLFLAERGQLDEAIRHLRSSLRLSPQNPGAEANLGLALAGEGRTLEARIHYRQALEIEPDFIEAQNDLAWSLATHPDAAKRDGAEALTLAKRCCEATNHNDATYLDTLAAASAETGDFPAAARWAQAALAHAGGDAGLTKDVNARLAAYQRGEAWREPEPPLPP